MTEKRKKIISVILSAVLCFTLLGTVGIHAEDIFEQSEEQPAEEIVEVIEEVPEVIVVEPVEEIPAEEPAEELTEEEPVEEYPEEEEIPEEEQPAEEFPEEELPEEEENLEVEETEEEELIEEEPVEELETLGAAAENENEINNSISTYFTDTNFRDVVAKALWAAQQGGSYTFDTGDVTGSLAAYKGEIVGNDKGIIDITGIKYLTNVTGFNLKNNQIEDIRPIESASTYHFSYFYLDGNPIHRIPHAGTDAYEAADVAYYNNGSTSISMNKSGWFSDDAAYVYGSASNTQQITYDAIMSGNDWRGGETKPIITGTSASFTDKGDYAEVTVNAEGEYQIAAETSFWREISAYADGLNPRPNHNSYSYDYHYKINNTFFGYVDNNASSAVLGGVKFTKTDNDENPVSGAEYGIYSDSACETAAKDHDGNSLTARITGTDGTVTWDNLDNGTYYVKETATPAGYLLNSTVYKLVVDTSSAVSGSATPVTGGEGDTVSVNADTTTWAPNWSTWTASQDGYSGGWGKLKITSGSKSSVTAASKGADVFIKNGGSSITLNCGSVDASKVTAKSASIKVTGSDNTFTAVADAEAYLNGIISGNKLSATNYSFTVSGSVVNQLNADYYNSDAIATGKDDSAPVYLKPSAFKTLVGNLLQADQFKFNLSGKDSINDIDETKGNDKYGYVKFDTVLEFDAPGTFNFKLKEVIPDTKDSRITYDENEREIKVVVTESGDSRGLKAVIKVDGEEDKTIYSSETANLDRLSETTLCHFENYCTQPLYILPTCYKILSGRTLKGGEFGFTLTGKDSVNEINLTAYNDVNGRVKFSNNPLKFDKAGFYLFKISEIIPDTKEANMTYDENVYTLSVTVEEDESTHTLSAVVKVNGTQVGNVITADKTTQVNGQVIENIGETKLCTFHNIYAAESRHNPVTGVKS